MRAMKWAVLAVVVLATTARQTQANQIFDFSFTNETIFGGNVPGTVTGEIILPGSGNYSGPASSVIIDTYPSPSTLDAAILTPPDAVLWTIQGDNNFVVTGGSLSTVDFIAENVQQPNQFAELVLLTGAGGAGLQTDGVGNLYPTVDGTPQYVPVASPTPEPASFALLGTGLLAFGGVGVRRWRRRPV
jgi:hypothetical protein